MAESNYVIKFTTVTNNDLEKIYRYISKELFAENAAVDLLGRIESNIMRLFSYLSNEFLRNKGYRKLIIDNYIVFYIALLHQPTGIKLKKIPFLQGFN